MFRKTYLHQTFTKYVSNQYIHILYVDMPDVRLCSIDRAYLNEKISTTFFQLKLK